MIEEPVKGKTSPNGSANGSLNGSPNGPLTDDIASPGHLRTLVLLIATVGGIYLCLRLIAPFIAPLAWALTLAAIFAPLQRWLEIRVKSPSIAALIAVLAIGTIVVVPTFLVGQKLIQQAANGAIMANELVKTGNWRQDFENQARLIPLIKSFSDQLDLGAFATTVTGWLSERAGALLAGSVFQLLSFTLTLYVLFFFLRDRKKALRSIRNLAPLTRKEMDRLILRFDDTIHATVYGTLATSAVQGALGGLMFWWLGLPSPLLWGVIMAILSVIPVLGAFVVWVPAAIYLAINGDWVKAIILASWGTLVVGSADNLLRPFMVGKRLEQHTVLAFFSVVGGLVFLGAVGLILGPLILTFTTVLLEIWTGRNANEPEPEPLIELGPPMLAPQVAAPTHLEPEPLGTSSPPER